jgi:hypothetical protein
MGFVKELEMLLYVPPHWNIPEDMQKRWQDDTKSAAIYAYQRLLKKISFDGKFIDTMAIPSSRAFQAMIDPSFISRKGRTAKEIINAQAQNMVGKYKQWVKNVQKAYANEAKAYKDKIDSSVEDWVREASKSVYRLTGSKKARSVVPVALHYLAGEAKAVGWITAAWTVDGQPYCIVSPRERSSLKAALEQRLVQGGMAVIHSEYSQAFMDEENALNALVLNRYRDPSRCAEFSPTKTADKCFCGWEMDGNLFLLHVIVGIIS